MISFADRVVLVGTFAAEDVAANLDQILDASGILLPGSIFDEMEHALTAEQLLTDARQSVGDRPVAESGVAADKR